MASEGRLSWVESPWKILLDVTRLDKIKVWEVKLAQILREFSMALKKQGYIDFNLCGIAILSAATIHRIKTQRLLQQDEPPTPKPRPEMLIPPPIQLPFKPEVVTTTLQELVEALQEALIQAAQEKAKTTPPAVQENRIALADFIVKIEKELGEFIEYLMRLLEERGSILFSELVRGKPKLEAAKIFILLLFAAARGYVLLLQQDESSPDLLIARG